MCQQVSGKVGVCVDEVEDCGVQVEYQVVQQYGEEEVVVVQVGVEGVVGLYVGGKEGQVEYYYVQGQCVFVCCQWDWLLVVVVVCGYV